MEEKFTICLVHDKDNIQNIIDTGKISITLESKEIAQLRDALNNGREELVMVERSEEEKEREQMLSQIDLLQGILNQLKSELRSGN